LSITFITANMISDGDLYRLAIFFGTTAMILIVLYHFLEVNAAKDPIEAGKEGAPKSL
jgi:oligosaccharyl transferase complex subunit OST4